MVRPGAPTVHDPGHATTPGGKVGENIEGQRVDHFSIRDMIHILARHRLIAFTGDCRQGAPGSLAFGNVAAHLRAFAPIVFDVFIDDVLL